MSRQYSLQEVIDKAVLMLKENQQGLNFSELVNKTHQSLEDAVFNTVRTHCVNLDQKVPDKVYKPDRGFYRHIEFREILTHPEPQPVIEVQETQNEAPQKIYESEFYPLFADWLVNDLEDCSKAIPLGGNIFRDRWGTPDVIGIRKSRSSDIVKHETEIITAEIKIEASELITAFGQTCAYGLFSHRTYLVVPKSASKEELGRIDSLCMLYGIGLVYFDEKNLVDPQFDIRVRAQTRNPDLFFLNQKIKLIEDDLF